MRKLQVLLVEDDNYKRDRISELFDDEVSLRTAGSVRDAEKLLREMQFDLMILDLNLPLRSGEEARRFSGASVLKTIFRQGSGLHVPVRIVGTTAYADLDSEYRSLFDDEGCTLIAYDNESVEWFERLKRIYLHERTNFDRLTSYTGIVLALHGIRTLANWHRTLVDQAQLHHWRCPIDGWWYGRFSLFEFLLASRRQRKLMWFREQYTREMGSNSLDGNSLPSIAAHSFGTYILGYSLLKYRDIRFEKVILCGCILPRNFPWSELIESGQVGEVLNNVGKHDPWPMVCQFMVPGTGGSGRWGFKGDNVKVEQIFHNLGHNEFFDARQIANIWFPFLERQRLNVSTQKSGGESIRECNGDLGLIPRALGPVMFLTLLLLVVLVTYFGSVLIVRSADYLFSFFTP